MKTKNVAESRIFCIGFRLGTMIYPRLYWASKAPLSVHGICLASFPGLHHSFCRLQYENRGEGLEGFRT